MAERRVAVWLSSTLSSSAFLLLCSGVSLSSSSSSSSSSNPDEQGLITRPFHGFGNVREVECNGDVIASDDSLLYMILYSPERGERIASVNVGGQECLTSGMFSSCVARSDSVRGTRLRTLVVDMRPGESRSFGCNITSVTSSGNTKQWSRVVVVRMSRTTTTAAPTTTTSTTTTIRPQPHSESPVASGVKSNVQEFQLPISVVIIGLVLLLFFAILCAILVILQCRGKRRRRSRAANRESLLSAKNEPMGEGGYRTPRNIPTYPPGHMPPETPGGNFAMRYQKSIPDTGYVSGSSVYYSEPYGTLDEEMKERLRPNPRMCHIPYDIKGGPLDTAGHPQEHSA